MTRTQHTQGEARFMPVAQGKLEALLLCADRGCVKVDSVQKAGLVLVADTGTQQQSAKIAV